jgi:hypothetical protein
MIKIEDKITVYVDVDDTLVLWRPVKEDDWVVNLPRYGYLAVSSRHVTSIKQHKARGHLIVVWSQGGADWAEEVVKLIGLEDYVDLVISKPRWIYDDKPASYFMPEIDRVYHEPT